MKTPPKPKFDVDSFIGGAATAKSADNTPVVAKRKKGVPPEGSIRATYNFPRSIHKALKTRALHEDKSMLTLVLEALEKTYDIKGRGR